MACLWIIQLTVVYAMPEDMTGRTANGVQTRRSCRDIYNLIQSYTNLVPGIFTRRCNWDQTRGSGQAALVPTQKPRSEPSGRRLDPLHCPHRPPSASHTVVSRRWRRSVLRKMVDGRNTADRSLRCACAQRGRGARLFFARSRIQKHPVRAKRRQAPRAPFSIRVRTRFARFIRAPS